MPYSQAQANHYRQQIADAQRELDQISSERERLHSRKTAISSQIDSCRYKIDDLKRSIEREYEGVRTCNQAHDRYYADVHRYNANSYREAKNREFSIMNGYIQESRNLKAELDRLRIRFNAALERKKEAQKCLRKYHENEQAQYREKRCRVCGGIIRYRVDWEHIPNVCKDCKAKRS